MKRLMAMVLLLTAVAAVPVGASTFLAMDRSELVKASAAVIEGQVLKVSSFWAATGRIVVTEAMIKVEDAVLGKTASVVVVRTFGGKVGDFMVEADGFPKFKVSERLLLFLEPEKDGANRVAGYQQGQFRVVTAASGVKIAVPAVDRSASIVTRDGKAAPQAQAVRLDALKDQIRAEGLRSGRFEN